MIKIINWLALLIVLSTVFIGVWVFMTRNNSGGAWDFIVGLIESGDGQVIKAVEPVETGRLFESSLESVPISREIVSENSETVLSESSEIIESKGNVDSVVSDNPVVSDSFDMNESKDDNSDIEKQNNSEMNSIIENSEEPDLKKNDKFIKGNTGIPGESVVFITQRVKPNYSAVLVQCADALARNWLVPVEWSLQREGCVAVSGLSGVDDSESSDRFPYSYRFYSLDEKWDENLSRVVFQKMTEGFSGKIVERPEGFILLMPHDLKMNVVNDEFVSVPEPETVLRRSFVANIRFDDTLAVTDLGLDEALRRLVDKPVRPNHVLS